jgi:hypothetical protein
MRAYQVYSIDENGSILGSRMIEAQSDEQAVFAARAMQRPYNTEVWHRDRRVARLAPHVL